MSSSLFVAFHPWGQRSTFPRKPTLVIILVTVSQMLRMLGPQSAELPTILRWAPYDFLLRLMKYQAVSGKEEKKTQVRAIAFFILLTFFLFNGIYSVRNDKLEAGSTQGWMERLSQAWGKLVGLRLKNYMLQSALCSLYCPAHWFLARVKCPPGGLSSFSSFSVGHAVQGGASPPLTVMQIDMTVDLFQWLLPLPGLGMWHLLHVLFPSCLHHSLTAC